MSQGIYIKNYVKQQLNEDFYKNEALQWKESDFEFKRGYAEQFCFDADTRIINSTLIIRIL